MRSFDLEFCKDRFRSRSHFDLSIADNTFLQFELLYSQYGYSIDISGSNLTVAYNTFEIPIISKLRIDIDDNEFHPLLLLGTSLAFRLSATATDSTGTADFSSVTNSTMFSLIFGTGVEYDLSPTESLFLNARYLLGLTNVSNTSTSAKQSTFQFTLGYLGTF
ncbi:MAG: PorT family protein [Spirulinaceae cyanobacterium RM2_2_10]|nr:PorT family protein [Spirulinaceae cyanobacterium RM2_2_10]